jgi:hypothetical protein
VLRQACEGVPAALPKQIYESATAALPREISLPTSMCHEWYMHGRCKS